MHLVIDSNLPHGIDYDEQRGNFGDRKGPPECISAKERENNGKNKKENKLAHGLDKERAFLHTGCLQIVDGYLIVYRRQNTDAENPNGRSIAFRLLGI